MGQQQLLLIALGVILVGVAVVLGIQYFRVGAEQAAKDELVAHSMTIGSNAQEWFSKPVSMGGGGLSFTGFSAYYNNNMTKLHNSTNGTYAVADGGGGTSVTVTATPATALKFTWHVQSSVFADSIGTQVIPN
jgi:hypothetical protein